ncbi:molybdopterin-guanine dinucleotide biosynthesis protein B [Halalkalibacter alkalisediminis]|uniref:Molybdopterin-guanine dinucleotide biosynthesis protein B n=1 Tax=Halalkalibacter alkalisediminis TaxID=935616 RepID=A0ABV6NQB9_9BACI|nr:molybdopterin-guanine dinucleotide biosynthesis protein B [Halalkalibacter alkalisediminis]
MEQYSRILQVVGYQNSGKSTLMEKVIKASSDLGWQVASIKHHGHHTAQKREGLLKDSERHEAAGAFMTAVEGGGSLQIHIKNQQWTLPKLVRLYEGFSPDVILVEGFKKEHYPKVVLLRGEEDLVLLEEVDQIVCAITWKPLIIDSLDFPIYNLTESDIYLEYILQKLSDDYGSRSI